MSTEVASSLEPAYSSLDSNAGDSSTRPASPTGVAENDRNSLPDISFCETTKEEKGFIQSLLSDNSNDTEKDFKSLFIHNLPQESIADEARVSPDRFNADMPDGNSYASFGDEGTTVTVNAYGNVMQITRSLGYGRSGLFCVDTSRIHGPTSPQTRLEQLMQLSKNPESGIRLEFLDGLQDRGSFEGQKPKTEFIFNRWPRFTWEQTINLRRPDTGGVEETSHPSMSLQYFCNKGTVFQRYTIRHDPRGPSAFQHSQLNLRRGSLIRSLDYVTGSAFNTADQYDEDYVYTSGSEGLSQIIIHRMTEMHAVEIGIDAQEYRERDGPKAVALVITVFINGKVQTLGLEGPEDICIQLGPGTRKEIENSTKFDVTVAYRLQTLASVQRWTESFIPASALSPMGIAFSCQSDTMYRSLRWSSHTNLNFIIGRNLEHILSVCSIPVPKASSSIHGTIDMDIASLALTCGDMSGHRITTKAAFFAFEFLIEILKYLCDKSKRTRDFLLDPKSCHCQHNSHGSKCGACQSHDKYIRHLRTRILETLGAHLTWVGKADESGTPEGAHYWITGKKIIQWQSCRDSGPASWSRVPFEIIKTHSLHQFYAANKDLVGILTAEVSNYVEILKGIVEPEALEQRLEGSIRSLLQMLYDIDKHCLYAFPRQNEDERKKYHLADQLWIWRAIKSVEEIGLEKHLALGDDIHYLEHPVLEDRENEYQTNTLGFRPPKESQRSTELRRIILKRFTTRNPQSQQRMLATSRTSAESRFLFHSKDTALFYAMDNGFFDRDRKINNRPANWNSQIDVWKETVDVQAEHEETQVMEWEKPLWHALALIISSKRKKINKSLADDTFDAAANFLFRISSDSGIFAGFLKETGDPIPFEDELDCDNYWNATFEIPYILWIYGKPNLEMDRPNTLGKRQRRRLQLKSGNPLLQPMKKKLELSLFSNLIEKNRQAELCDDWLREVPSLLNFDSKTPISEMHLYRWIHSDGSRDFGRVINSALADENMFLHESPNGCTGTVIDVPKNSSTREDSKSKNDLERYPETNASMQTMLREPRTTLKAKKRLIWLPAADKMTALICHLASSRTEQDGLSAFFDRHASYENHFSDDTSAALNQWTTEIHLSYFRKTDWNPRENKIREKNQSIIPDLSFILVDPQMMPDSDHRSTRGAKIVRSVMSFRFVGDFSDRYWTCHFLECDPVKARSEEEGGELKSLRARLSDLGFEPVEELKSPWRRKQPWQQRKVLELLLLDYILGEIQSSTEGLLSWVREVILKKDKTSQVDGIDMVSIVKMPFRVQATKPLNPLAEAVEASVESLVGNEGDGLFSIAERWRFFAQVLKTMEDDLNGNLRVISSWTSREKEREAEGLRWTRNDQAIYQQVIDKLRFSTQRRIRELDGLRVGIRTFRDTFTRKLDTMRSDLEYRYSENTSLFTYVTVVFLPLGFATGILSMSGAPDRSTLTNMITLSLIAMAITLFALANAKTTGKKIVRPVLIIFRSINNWFLDPLVGLLGSIFSFLCNVLLLLGLMIRFSVLVFFYLFFALPLSPVVKQSLNEAYMSVKEAYMSIIKVSQSINDMATDRHNLDPLNVAKELFKVREAKRKAKLQNGLDVERGDPDMSSSENEEKGPQGQG